MTNKTGLVSSKPHIMRPWLYSLKQGLSDGDTRQHTLLLWDVFSDSEGMADPFGKGMEVCWSGRVISDSWMTTGILHNQAAHTTGQKQIRPY